MPQPAKKKTSAIKVEAYAGDAKTLLAFNLGIRAGSSQVGPSQPRIRFLCVCEGSARVCGDTDVD